MFKEINKYTWIILLIAGVIEKDMFSTLSIFTTLLAFVMTDEPLGVLFGIKVSNKNELRSSDNSKNKKLVDKAAIVRVRVFILLLFFNLFLIIVLMDRYQLGPVILEMIKNAISVFKNRFLNEMLVTIINISTKGLFRYLSVVRLLQFESFLYRKFKKQIANTLTKEIRFF